MNSSFVISSTRIALGSGLLGCGNFHQEMKKSCSNGMGVFSSVLLFVILLMLEKGTAAKHG